MSLQGAIAVTTMVKTFWPKVPYATDEEALAWATCLADLPDDALQEAVAGLVRTSRWCPTVAEIREAAGSATLSPLEAWAAVLSAVRRVGPYRIPDWPTTEVAAAVRETSSWLGLCRAQDSALPALKSKFLDAYRRGVGIQGAQRLTEGAPVAKGTLGVGEKESPSKAPPRLSEGGSP